MASNIDKTSSTGLKKYDNRKEITGKSFKRVFIGQNMYKEKMILI